METTFDKYMLTRAGMRFYMSECERLKRELELERKVSKDLLFKNNKLTTELMQLKNPVNKLEKELFPNS